MDFLWIGIIFSVGIIIFCIYGSIKNRRMEEDFIYSARRIRAGMSKDDVLDIMGHDYTYSALKGGVEKYEWRLRKNGYSYRVSKGVSVRQSGYTRRIAVKFKDGVVIETSSLNMD